MPKFKSLPAEPVMSDATILVSVENLINIAMGPPHTNVINYKMLQKVLHILARQMRMLEQQVEIRVTELEKRPKKSRASPRSRAKTAEDSDDTDDGRVGRGGKRSVRGDKGSVKGDRGAIKGGKSKERDASGVVVDDEDDFDEKGKRKIGKDEEDYEGREAGRKGKDGLDQKGKAGKDGISPDGRAKEGKGGRGGLDETGKGGKYGKGASGEKEKAGLEDEERTSKGRKGDIAMTGKMGRGGKGGADDREYAGKKLKGGEDTGRTGRDEEGISDDEEAGYDGKINTAERRKLGKGGKADTDEAGTDHRGGRFDTEDERKFGTGGRSGRGELRSKSGRTEKAEYDDDDMDRRGPKSRGKRGETGSRTRVGSIEVVTLSQFELLEAMVDELKAVAGPLPLPSMPDNKQLRSELMKGNASLAQTMEAMQIQARLLAAEEAISRLAAMVTMLVSAGVLPEGLAEQFAGSLKELEDQVAAIGQQTGQLYGQTGPASGQAYGQTSSHPSGAASGKASGKSVAIDPQAKDALYASEDGRGKTLDVRSYVSMSSKSSMMAPVTHPQMDAALEALKADLLKNINQLTGKASTAADTAANTATFVSEKLDVALKLNTRVTDLRSMVEDYAEQLSGFDAGLSTQMTSFQEQMQSMRTELKDGLAQLEAVNNNAETAAVLELTERYENLALELDNTMTSHQLLTSFQNQLSNDLRLLLEAVEMLREQKADRDEVLDGLRDKADLSRLAGLLTEQEFSLARSELEKRLELCYDKFIKQENVWLTALKDLSAIVENKAELMQLLAARDEAEVALNDIQDKLKILFEQLGEPKAAILTRLLSRDGKCGPCGVEALMEAVDPTANIPPQLPPAIPAHGFRPPDGEVCPGLITKFEPHKAHDTQEHVCHRWVGGSHTLIGESVTKEKANPTPLGYGPRPTRKYTDIGDDGRLYLFEEELQPCKECNRWTEDELLPTTPVPETGAGDNVVTTTSLIMTEDIEKKGE